MTLLKIFFAFFIAGILGYGGGPAFIPLIENEVVERFGWMTVEQFSEVLAFGNALPGSIATKMAGYIGYDVGGIPGLLVAVFAMVAPSLILMIVLLNTIKKHKDSPKVKRMTTYIRPVVAVLLGTMAYKFFLSSYHGVGLFQTLFIGGISFLLMEKVRIHPAFVIGGALVYGSIFLR